MKQFYLILVGVLFNVYLTEAQTVKGVLVSSDTELPRHRCRYHARRHGF